MNNTPPEVIEGISRALIIKKHWLDLILSGQKTWEMRSRATTITGWIGLIEQGSGLILGKAFLTAGWHRPSKQELIDNQHLHRVEDLDLIEKWCYAWTIENAQKFEVPIPYLHPKGAVIWVRI